MKIYKTLLLYTLLGLFSKSYGQSKEIIGVWTIFFQDEKVTSLNCAVCPKFEFKSDKTLIFTKPNSEAEYSTWGLDKDNMLSIGKTFTSSKGVTENKMFNRKLKVLFSKSELFDEIRFDVDGKVAPLVLRK